MAVSQVFQKYRREIISSIDCDSVLIEILYSDEVINERQYQQIKAEAVPIQAAEKLLDFIQYAGLQAFLKFCLSLDIDYAWLADKLRHEAKETGLDVESLSITFGSEDFENCEVIQCKDSVPTECQLMRFSKVLVRSDWLAVMYELGLRTSDIEQNEHLHSEKRLQCKSCLVLWLRSNGSAATFEVLHRACKTADVDRECVSALVAIANST